jgi:hypothetical protein
MRKFNEAKTKMKLPSNDDLKSVFLRKEAYTPPDDAIQTILKTTVIAGNLIQR